MPIYEKPVRLLMRDMVSSINLKVNDLVTKEQIVAWFRANYHLIKPGTVSAHLVLLSTNDCGRLHHNPRKNGDDDLFFKIDSGTYRLYDPSNDPTPVTQETKDDIDISCDGSRFVEGPGTGTTSEFAYEHDLRDYLARNLHLIEPGLRLYQDEGITGIEFPVGGRFVDILAIDNSGGYVVELKVSKGYDRVVGQLLRYIAWIEQNHAEPDQSVRGVIVAKAISEDLILACSKVRDVSLFEYALAVSLTRVESKLNRSGR
jgi:hypothetical protein